MNKKIKELIAQVNRQIRNNDVIHASMDLRILLEETVNTLFSAYPEGAETLFEKIEYLKENDLISKEDADLFHTIRIHTNKAVHEYETDWRLRDLDEAFEQLEYFIKEHLKSKKQKKKKQSNTLTVILVLLIIAAAVLLGIEIYLYLNK